MTRTAFGPPALLRVAIVLGAIALLASRVWAHTVETAEVQVSNWTVAARMTYYATPVCGGAGTIWAWDRPGDQGWLDLHTNAQYTGQTIYYRALLGYGTNVVVWESSPQATCDQVVLAASQDWGYGPFVPDPSSFEGTTSNGMWVKGQSGLGPGGQLTGTSTPFLNDTD